MVEKRLAERERHLAELFDKLGPSPQRTYGKTASRWAAADNHIAKARVDLALGTKVFYMTPNEAWRTKSTPMFWEVYLHRVVQYMLLVSGVDKQQELLQKVHTMTIEELVAW